MSVDFSFEQPPAMPDHGEAPSVLVSIHNWQSASQLGWQLFFTMDGNVTMDLSTLSGALYVDATSEERYRLVNDVGNMVLPAKGGSQSFSFVTNGSAQAAAHGGGWPPQVLNLSVNGLRCIPDGPPLCNSETTRFSPHAHCEMHTEKGRSRNLPACPPYLVAGLGKLGSWVLAAPRLLKESIPLSAADVRCTATYCCDDWGIDSDDDKHKTVDVLGSYGLAKAAAIFTDGLSPGWTDCSYDGVYFVENPSWVLNVSGSDAVP